MNDTHDPTRNSVDKLDNGDWGIEFATPYKTSTAKVVALFGDQHIKIWPSEDDPEAIAGISGKKEDLMKFIENLSGITPETIAELRELMTD